MFQIIFTKSFANCIVGYLKFLVVYLIILHHLDTQNRREKEDRKRSTTTFEPEPPNFQVERTTATGLNVRPIHNYHHFSNTIIFCTKIKN